MQKRNKYIDNCSKTSASLWQYYRDILAVKITAQTSDNGTKVVERMIPLKYLSNFWRTIEMPLINCELNLILTWSGNCVMVSTNNVNQDATFAITETKLYVPVVTLSTQDNAKLSQHL